MEWVETTGRTVEEAKEAALDQLGVDEQDAEFEVVEEPRMGLFGRLRTEARVRARVRPTRPRPKDDRRGRRRRRGEEPPGPPKGQGGDEQVREETGGDAPGAPGRPAGVRSNEGADMDEDVPLAEQGEVAGRFLTGLLEAFGMPGEVSVHERDEETVELAVSGEELGLLIGQRGSTLGALQEVTRTVVQRQTGGRNARILVDVAGYRQKRREALGRFARQVADEVRQTGVAKALEPMGAADRKVVHDTVNEINGVSTTSAGEEPGRRVIIEPQG